MSDRKTVVETLAKHFGGCGCKTRCEREQACGDDGEWMDSKPNGRFSVCEIEADDLGVTLLGADSEDETP
jgi:hypothetical protein